MAVINVATREIHAKVVYYGPGFSGKTTNLEYIYRRVPKESKGEMLSLATETERTLFFDFLLIARYFCGVFGVYCLCVARSRYPIQYRMQERGRADVSQAYSPPCNVPANLAGSSRLDPSERVNAPSNVEANVTAQECACYRPAASLVRAECGPDRPLRTLHSARSGEHALFHSLRSCAEPCRTGRL